MISGSAKCAKDFLDLDGILIIKEQITQHFDPIFLNSDYYTLLMGILGKVLGNDVPFMGQLKDKKFLEILIRFFQECYNVETVLNILLVTYELAQYPDVRKILCELGIYQQLIKHYDLAVEDKDNEVLYKILMNFARFTLEKSFRVHLNGYLDTLVGDAYMPFFLPFENEASSTTQVKAASLAVIRNVILLGDNKEARSTLVSSGYIKMLITKCMSDPDGALLSVGLDCLLSVTDLIKNQLMTMDDIIITTSKNFWDFKDSDKRKFLLLLVWGLLSKSFNSGSLDPVLVRQIIGKNPEWYKEQNIP